MTNNQPLPQKTFMSIRFLLMMILALSRSGIVCGQCMMIPLSLEYQVSNSDLIVEGVVKDKSSFYNAAGNYIYTNYQIEITKVFKGQIQKSVVDVVEAGGTIGTKSIAVNPSISLLIDGAYTIFLEQYTFRDPEDQLRYTNPVFRAYASSQSVFSYDFYGNTIDGFFNQYPLDDWYDIVTASTGIPYSERKELIKPSLSHSRVVPVINNMSPLSITSGTLSVLTITGTGFGATQGSSTVEFKNADDGGATWLNTLAGHFVSWSDVQIQVKVPYHGGSGQVRVTVGGTPFTSSQSLSVTYSQFCEQYDIGGGQLVLFRRHLQNHNGLGGFTFRYHTEINTNIPCRKSFERALNSWRCATAVNFIAGDVTTIDVAAEDGTNVIRFDNGNEIPAGVGAQTSSYFDACVYPAINAVHVTEIDMVFNDAFPGITWQFGPAAPSATEVDFESITLHELGHACCLGHVISPPEVMHYSISPGESKRVLSANDIAGGTFVQGQNTGNPAYCSKTPMTNYRQIKYVNINTTGNKTGDTWDQAYKYLQDALGVVTPCVDTIYVASGTYYPDEGDGQTNNSQTLRFTLNSSTVFMGGYNASTGVRDLAGSSSKLSGDIDLNGITDGANSQNVVRITGNATLDGFYIERGYADAASGEGKDGAGVYMSNNCVLRNCVIRNNLAPGVAGNLGRGGGIFELSGFPNLYNCLFYQNSAFGSGSAVQCMNNVLSCYNCTIVSNNTSGVPAVKIDDGFHVFRNCIFWNNDTDMAIINPPGSAELNNTMMQMAAFPAGAFGSNVLFNTDPLFTNLGANDFSIVPCSPGVNTGDNTYNPTTTDLFGNARIVQTTIDRGALENSTGIPSTVVTNTADTGAGSLRTIIANACSGNTITFSAPLLNQTILLTGPQIDINKNLTINGLGLDQLIISANGTHRHFNITSGIMATIKNINLTEGNSTASNGNCISNNGNLTLQNIRMVRKVGASNPITLSNNTSATAILMNQVFVQ